MSLATYLSLAKAAGRLPAGARTRPLAFWLLLSSMPSLTFSDHLAFESRKPHDHFPPAPAFLAGRRRHRVWAALAWQLSAPLRPSQKSGQRPEVRQ